MHLVGPYYANTSWCRVHRMSVYRLREFLSEYFRTGHRNTVRNHGIIRPTVQLHADNPFWGVGICANVTVTCLSFQKCSFYRHIEQAALAHRKPPFVATARHSYGTQLQNLKGKFHPRTGHEGPEGEWRYSSTLSLTSEIDGVRGQRHTSAALPPRKTWYPFYRRLGGPQGRSGQMRKISPPHREVLSYKRNNLYYHYSYLRAAQLIQWLGSERQDWWVGSIARDAQLFSSL